MERLEEAARVETEEDGTILVRSPGVGFWSDMPRAGATLGAGSGIGVLTRGNRKRSLVLPAVTGRVRGGAARDRIVPVEYGEVLLRLSPLDGGETGAVEDARPGHAGLAEGTWAVTAPTDGVFYACPSPGAAPFVRVGARVRTGQAIGLVEVMKTFNQIVYGGPGLPSEAEVIEVRSSDREEVRAGAILIVVR
jgi:hypothetical protein